MTKPYNTLWIIGAGGHGRAVAEAAQLCGWKQLRFIDDVCGTESSVDEWPVVGSTENLMTLLNEKSHCIVAIGNQAVRVRLAAEVTGLGARLETIIHPAAWVSAKAKVGDGSAIMAGAVVGVNARLGTGVIVNANATVDHDVIVGDFAHLGVGVQLAGSVVIGERAWLQAGCSAGYNVIVDADTVVEPGTALSASTLLCQRKLS